MSYFLYILIAIVLIWLIFTFNSLIFKRNRVKNAWSDIDVQLKKRYDLVPNLVEVVKGYAGHETKVLENITKARATAMNASKSGASESGVAEINLTQAIRGLFVAVENYPDLKASSSFLGLQQELVSMENDIESARRYYNAAVRELNNALQIFPTNTFATILGFKAEEYFGASTNERAEVKVSV